MNDWTAERLLTESPPAREEREDCAPCHFLDGAALGQIELRGLVKHLERDALYGASFEGSPDEWAFQAQAYFTDHRITGDHPHDIVVVEHVRSVKGATFRSRKRHLGFVLRSDYVPEAVFSYGT